MDKTEKVNLFYFFVEQNSLKLMSRSALSKNKPFGCCSISVWESTLKEARRQDYIEVSARVNTLTYEIP